MRFWKALSQTWPALTATWNTTSPWIEIFICVCLVMTHLSSTGEWLTHSSLLSHSNSLRQNKGGARYIFFYCFICFIIYGPNWLDSDLIPRLLEIFEKLKTFMIILLNVTNDTYSRILSAWACSRAGILQFEIWKLQTGATTLKNDFFQKVLLSSYRTLKVTSPVRFSWKIIRPF